MIALLSTFFFTFYDILARVLSVKSRNPRAFSVVYNSFCALIVVGLSLLEKPSFNRISSLVIFLTFIATVLWGIFNRVEFYAHKYMEVSLRTIVGKVAPLTTFLATALFLGEAVTTKKILAAILILGSTVFVLYKKDGKIGREGLMYTLATSVSLGLAWTMDKKVSVFYPTSFYVLLGYSIPTLYVWAIPPLPFKVIKEEFRSASWKIVLLAAINVLGYYSLMKAFAYGEASKTTLIVSTHSIFIILAGIILLKERSDVTKKLLAGVVATAGVLLLK